MCLHGGRCKRSICFFAHSEQQLRLPDSSTMPPQHLLAAAAAEDGVLVYSCAAAAAAAGPAGGPAPPAQQRPRADGHSLHAWQPPPAQPVLSQAPSRAGFWELHCKQQQPGWGAAEACGAAWEGEGEACSRGRSCPPAAPAAASRGSPPSRSSSGSSRAGRHNFWGSHVEQRQPGTASSSGLCSPRSQGAQQPLGSSGASTCSAASGSDQLPRSLGTETAPLLAAQRPLGQRCAFSPALPAALAQLEHGADATWCTPPAPLRHPQTAPYPGAAAALPAATGAWPLMGAAGRSLAPLAGAQPQLAVEQLQLQLVPQGAALQGLRLQQPATGPRLASSWPTGLLAAVPLGAEQELAAWVACPLPGVAAGILGC
jgi:hypothetical protein